MKTWGNGGVAQHILNLSTRWRWVVTFIPCSLHSLDRRLGGPQSQSGRGGAEIISLFLLGIKPQLSSL